MEVSLAHPLSDITAIHGWVGHNETVIMSSASTLSCAGNKKSNSLGEKHRKIVSHVIEKDQDQVFKMHNKTPLHLALRQRGQKVVEPDYCNLLKYVWPLSNSTSYYQ